MATPFQRALDSFSQAFVELFEADPRVRAVGITSHEGNVAYRVIRNDNMLLPLGISIHQISSINNVPVIYINTPREIQSLISITSGQPPSGMEAQAHNPLVSGLQIQNFDRDSNGSIFSIGMFYVGTLGCFVQLASGKTALLSNNHVIAGCNTGMKRNDRILHPGALVFDPTQEIARLVEFEELMPSPWGARLSLGNINYNEIDAGVAELGAAIRWQAGYLPARQLPTLTATARVQVGDKVFKVGRTTGLTYGTITSIGVTLGPIIYPCGPCWFRDSIEIEGEVNNPFSGDGDSGAAIVRESGNEVVGILYAGNGVQSYACPIDTILTRLNCSLHVSSP